MSLSDLCQFECVLAGALGLPSMIAVSILFFSLSNDLNIYRSFSMQTSGSSWDSSVDYFVLQLAHMSRACCNPWKLVMNKVNNTVPKHISILRDYNMDHVSSSIKDRLQKTKERGWIYVTGQTIPVSKKITNMTHYYVLHVSKHPLLPLGLAISILVRMLNFFYCHFLIFTDLSLHGTLFVLCRWF